MNKLIGAIIISILFIIAFLIMMKLEDVYWMLIPIFGLTVIVMILYNQSVLLYNDAIAAKMTDEKAKEISIAFFYTWYNTPGTNTSQGFDDWWKINKNDFVEDIDKTKFRLKL